MSPDQTVNFNQNVADCIRASHSVGGDTFYNVCTGAHYWVPWGSADWLGVIGGTIAVLAIAAVVILIVAASVTSKQT
ncbi:MAG: hypothetical protein NTX56_04035 [Proteobacteria bacterium]|nr:hypothetical protein [Pseudomonadota bacterium]